ncbi:cupin domain-containing protein [Streptomyces mooreae]|uniref:cupin domain-containing protein n=1 Tax=Streptomyces mooreae TaxID=3075523 RepID=UPI00374E06B2
MDVFSDLIRGVRAHGSLFGSSPLSPPWALHFVDGAPLTLCTVLTGAGWIVPEHRPPEPLRARETIIVRGPATFTFVDEVGTRAEPLACGEHCATPRRSPCPARARSSTRRQPPSRCRCAGCRRRTGRSRRTTCRRTRVWRRRATAGPATTRRPRRPTGW